MALNLKRRRTLTWALLVTALVVTGCRHPYGRFVYYDVESEVEDRTLSYGVYLPPMSRWDGKARLPLVVLLHGARDDETSADRRRVVRGLDRAIKEGSVPPFIMVTPRGELGFWVNWADGSHRYRDWVLEEVIPDARAKYPLSDELHLVGVSMGGGGGLQMWLQAPERFTSATILSAPILNGDETKQFLLRFIPETVFDRVFGREDAGVAIDPYPALASPEDLGGSRLLFGAATRDHPGILDSNRRFHEHLQRASIPHRFMTFTGRHGWKAWARAFPEALRLQLVAAQDTSS
jgi:enterochelin esterase-like enzyme